MRTAVITIAAGRLLHLRRQHDGLRRSAPQPDARVVVAMRPGDLPAYRRVCGPAARLVEADGRDGPLPLAAARNAGAREALRAGAELLIFLDADCIPAPRLLERYAAAAAASSGPALLCGPVAHLPPAPPGGHPPAALPRLGRAHAARPALPDEELLRAGGDHRLFWSLSFAVSAGDWERVGGFSQEYVGYGGEDTDFGQRARAAGVDLAWVGGAWAYHQHHPVSSPPVEHLDDILANATRFHRRWGWWPMEGWLAAFARMGLARHDRRTNRWLGCDPPASSGSAQPGQAREAASESAGTSRCAPAGSAGLKRSAS
ncbi:galactosyltransferase-related protein [Conexibacter sp. CPCC 205706]|uniref:glycosyltransferase family 2 protein n=1 Tax=unclassified Conexibacter TaxID=2627773 RepID=UPI00271B2A25|nr:MULTISPECIES: galactosyltransferase-related protein [unclassified Conexibacter]MDO8188525.1 galactosyltransferase-related protein [Conexibacter sp. CPCC 205706]MDO8200131.1 galactosyltransferase-related protein [Conexibacter sp. CPCC 205762]